MPERSLSLSHYHDYVHDYRYVRIELGEEKLNGNEIYKKLTLHASEQSKDFIPGRLLTHIQNNNSRAL